MALPTPNKKFAGYYYKIYTIAGIHVRQKPDGMLWIPKPNARVQAILDAECTPIDNRHWWPKTGVETKTGTKTVH